MEDRTLRILEKGLDLSMVRQRLLVENVANVETPGYKRKDLDFESILQKEYQKGENQKLKLRTTDLSHWEGTTGRTPLALVKEEEFSVRQDGSGVDMEKEMTIVLENALYYQTLSKMVAGKLNSLSVAIREVK